MKYMEHIMEVVHQLKVTQQLLTTSENEEVKKCYQAVIDSCKKRIEEIISEIHSKRK